MWILLSVDLPPRDFNFFSSSVTRSVTTENSFDLKNVKFWSNRSSYFCNFLLSSYDSVKFISNLWFKFVITWFKWLNSVLSAFFLISSVFRLILIKIYVVSIWALSLLDIPARLSIKFLRPTSNTEILWSFWTLSSNVFNRFKRSGVAFSSEINLLIVLSGAFLVANVSISY